MDRAGEADSVYTLTDAGWPRPNIGGWPIPWVAPAERLSEVNEGRRLASVGGAICQVCGEGWPWDGEAFGFVVVENPVPLAHGDYLSSVMPAGRLVSFLDGALLHRRCARLTVKMCPHFKTRGDLRCVMVPANDATPKPVDGVLRPHYPAGDVMYVPWPT